MPINKRPDPFRARLRSLLMLVLLGVGVLVTTVLSALAAGAGSVGEGLGLGLRVLAIIVSVAAMCGLFVLAFRALTARAVNIRDVLPGAIMAAVAWQILQSLGAVFVRNGLMGSTQVYGLFGIVLGLLAWIYLEAVIIVLATELNAVVSRRLYPRSLLTPFVEDVDLTRADRRSYTSYASTQQFKESQTTNVEFEPRRESNGEPEGSGQDSERRKP